jgi:eukaryotic-like serine/threonine-protein kinase
MKVVASVEYQKIQEIGAGEGMNSKVYLVRDPQLAGDIAVKEVPKSDFGNDVNLYFAEAQAMYRTKHDNIVPVHYACATGTHVCIAMPFFRRGSFARIVQAGPAPLSLVLSTGRAILAALAQIHLVDLLHLDVKPSNVLLSDRGVPMLADFGQSRRMTAAGVATVPRLYHLAVPPEAYSGVVALPSDIYQAGLLLYRAANGDPHFMTQWTPDHVKQADAVKRGRFPRRDGFLPHVPQRLRTAIRKALRVKPDERYQSAIEFADAIGKVACELDWATTIGASGDYTWRCHRVSQSDLVVVATPAGATWSVEVYTASRSIQRAKGRSVFWKTGLSWKQAEKHLTEVFENLR